MYPGSRVKSEYMKRYQEPRWDKYGPCYRELLHYRQGRRQLEQAHEPWLWDNWGPAGASDDSASSASSGAGGPAGPAPQCAPAEPAEPAARAGAEDPARGPAEAAQAEEARGAGSVDSAAAALPVLLVEDIKEKPDHQMRTRQTDKVPDGAGPRQRPSALLARGNRKAAKSPPRPLSKIKENKHPFALYGWGERKMDIGSQKTHNVCASAPVHEIHESALRAKNRRQVEKNRRVKPLSSEDPWMTEYMRCYSTRAGSNKSGTGCMSQPSEDSKRVSTHLASVFCECAADVLS